MKPYPRFVPNDVETLFIHWLNFEKYHKGETLKDTSLICNECNLFKDCMDFGVIQLLHSILQTWEKKLKGSNIASLLLGYMNENEARYIYENVPVLDSDTCDYHDIGKQRINQMLEIYFDSITYKEMLEISTDIGHYLPFITHCVIQFKTLSVSYNELIMCEFSENFYYMVEFVFLNFHLNGTLAFSPSVVTFMWSELLCESIIAWFYNKKFQNVQ